ncbi:MAG TPA: HD-GYP domain-containing protein [Terriglobales bacterium]|nr:HD-GYP domain-containing protein [Terriglobales bacterium]
MSDPEAKEQRPAERRPDTRPDVKALPKEAVELLIRLHVVIKNAKLYEANNEMFQEQARLLFELIEHFLKEKGEASFQVRQSALFFNGLRFKFVLSTYPIYKFILEEFRRRNVSFLSFLNGLTREELVRFAVAFSQQEKKEAEPFPKLLASLEKADVGHVIVRTAFGAETFASTHEDTARMFFLGIIHLKEIFEREKKGEGLPVNTTRRLMQSIFNHIVDDESFLVGLTNLKNYDEYTLNHSVNVCVLSLALGRRLGLSRSELVELGIAAFFHDLGKLETPLDILNKPATLDPEEREIMEQHPYQGAEKLIHLKEFRHLPIRAIHVALEHHIREDLTGYPSRLRKEDVNLFSKIVKVVDYFDALTTRRVYRKKAFTRTEALGLMLEQSGTEFNPAILKAFVNLMGVYPIGTMVALSTGELGIVADINPDAKLMLRPKVKLIADVGGNLVDGDTVDLSDRNPDTGKFPRTIVKVLDPTAYGIEVSDYFLAQAQ